MSEQNSYVRHSGMRGEAHHPALALNGVPHLQNAMAMELHVFLRGAALPTREEWQAGITDHGFPLTLDETLDVRSHTGFSSVIFWGRKSGFEFGLSPANVIASQNEGTLKRIGARDLAANFRWRGNMLESVIVYLASAVFTKLTDGVLYYPQKNHFSTGQETMAMARQLIEVAELD
jgi:hypothetical protein